MSSAPQINTGISHERLHALKLKPKAVQDPATHDASAQKVSQQATGLKWLDVSKNDKSLKTGDGVYLSVISSALSKDRVEAPVTSSAAPRVDLKQKLVNLGKDKLAKAAKDVSSFNFFVAEIAKNVLGAIRFGLSKLGVSHGEIQDVIDSAVKEKRVAVRTGVVQAKEEQILHCIVTGSRMA